ncbi:MAG: glutamyl-tRNA reductase, partial [bacterium]
MTKDFTLDKLMMVGINYKKTPLEIRERVSFTLNNIEDAYQKIKQDNVLKEAVIISTCNRSEICAVVNNSKEDKEYLTGFYSDFFNIKDIELNEHIVFRSKEDLIKYLFEGTCGFHSMVLGEDQVLGQIKESYKTSIKCKASGKILSRLFLDSVAVAKKVKALTGISKNPVSVSTIGVKLIERKLTDISTKTALVIGLSEMNRITIQNLITRDIKTIYVTNRTRRRCQDFSKQFPDIIQLDFKDRYNIIGDVDIIVSCTAAPHNIITKDKFLEYYKNQPLCVLDLAIPRDIDPDIGNIDGV